MLISKDFVEDFVDIKDIDPSEFANKLTLSTAEVEGVEKVQEFLKNIKVVEISKINKHPNAEKLNLVTFILNEKNETKEVVCGAGNVREGLKVPYATLGTVLPGDFKLEPKKIRGILSEGMLCSAEELGLSDECDGLYELNENAKVGQSLLDYLGLKTDTIIDIDNKSLTHRQDLWGHYGFAREASVIFGRPLVNKFDHTWKENLEKKIDLANSNSTLKIHVGKDSSCLGFLGIEVSGVEVVESPNWMKDRLNKLGLRPINSIVDISNYVMIELGHPLHIYDREKISGNTISVDTVENIKINGEKPNSFKTLDEIDRKLEDSDTVIYDDEKPLVLAGVMGGLTSGVSENTKTIYIEVANWKASKVRQTSTRLGLRTESSQRYEKGLDTQQLKKVLLRTLDLVLQFNPQAKIVGSIEKDNLDSKPFSLKKIQTSSEKICNILGKDIKQERIIEILSKLEFNVEKLSDGLEITLPSFRDKNEFFEADIIEEVGRIIGYDNITPSSPKVELTPVRLSNEKLNHRKIQDFLINNVHALECITYPLIGKNLLKKVDWPTLNESTKIVNALSNEFDRLRPSLIPSIIDAVKKNSKHQSSFKIFEIGRFYNALVKSEDFYEFNESNCLIIAHYSKSKNVFIDALNDFKRLCNFMAWPIQIQKPNDKFEVSVLPKEFNGVHPHELLHVRAMGKVDGAVFTLHPRISKNFKLGGNITISILKLDSLEKKVFERFKKYIPISKFPSATFDCTVIVGNNLVADDIFKAVNSCKIKHLDKVRIKDTFKLADGRKTFTIGCWFRDSTQTLPSELLKDYENKIVRSLEKSGFPLKEG